MDFSQTPSSANSTHTHRIYYACPQQYEILGQSFLLPRSAPTSLTQLSLSKNERILLHWHRLFGHLSLRKIRHIFQERLCLNLPLSLPKGEIKCDVCARGKSLLCNNLSPSGRTLSKLDVITADIVGPFEMLPLCSAKQRSCVPKTKLAKC
ncbi:hypothetical protein VP01_1224g4 [Puccinia sorghi]|uniref:GAG-pre-integrase domain-containing protein n=1 Tax=Puccinia sorghi TaxID=27349 RepID=A0A0L6VQ57_9BASI|nr:hypothetical protein VP01_1224g4 [Puccinia sorghi]